MKKKMSMKIMYKHTDRRVKKYLPVLDAGVRCRC